MPKSPKLYLKKRYIVPIYNAKIWLVVCDNVKHERSKMDKVLGGPSLLDDDNYDGLCSSNYSYFALFFERGSLQSRAVNLIAHEIFHLTHRIIEWAGANFDEDNHEHGAILHGYLMDLIWRDAMRFRKS